MKITIEITPKEIFSFQEKDWKKKRAAKLERLAAIVPLMDAVGQRIYEKDRAEAGLTPLDPKRVFSEKELQIAAKEFVKDDAEIFGTSKQSHRPQQ